MTALNIIFGILMVIGGTTILSVPTFSGLTVYWILSIFMFIAGVIAIIHFFETKNAEKVAKKHGLAFISTGVGGLIFGIAAVVLSILSMTSVTGAAVFAIIIGIVFGVWILFSGISSIVAGIALKKVALPGWLPMIILGVLVGLMGIFCIVDSFKSIVAIGTLFGISMIMRGFALMFNPVEPE